MRITPGGPFIQRHFALIFGGIWLVVGAPFLIGGVAMWQHEERFAREAVTTEGKVLTRAIRTAQRSSSSGSSTSSEYHVSYRFLAPDGVTREGDSKVGVHVWERLADARRPEPVSFTAGSGRLERGRHREDQVRPRAFAQEPVDRTWVFNSSHNAYYVKLWRHR